MAIRHDITLSTTEPNNDIGLLKIRQADEQTQTLVVQLTATSQPKSYEGLQAFFCAKLGQSVGLGIIEQKLEQSEMTNPKNGQLEYTFRPEDWQQIGRQTGYFSFRKMKDDGHEYVEQFTTRDFYFNVTKNVFSEGLTEVKKDGSTYVWTIEDLIRLFNEYIASGKSDWEEFVDQNREVLESVDPGGLILSELIRSRKPDGAETPYPDLPTRLDEQIGKNSDFRDFESEKSFMKRVFNESGERGINIKWLGLKPEPGFDNAITLTAYLSENQETTQLLVPPGTFEFLTDVEIPENVTLQFVNGGNFKPMENVNLKINGVISAGDYQIFEDGGGVIAKQLSASPYNLAWYEGDSINKKYDFARRDFLEFKTKTVIVPRPAIGRPGTYTDSGNRTFWLCDGPILIDDSGNSAEWYIYGEFIAQSSFEAFIKISGPNKPENVYFYGTVQLYVPSNSEFMVECGIHVLEGARINFYDQVVINGCNTSVLVGGDGQKAPASAMFNILQCSFFSENGVKVDGNFSNASTIYVEDLSITGCTTAGSDGVFLTGLLRDIHFGRILYSTESKDGYTSFDLENVVHITSRGTQTIQRGNIEYICSLNANTILTIDAGAANAAGVQFLAFGTIIKKFNGNAFKINYCSSVDIKRIFNGAGLSVFGQNTSACTIAKNNLEKITDLGSNNLIGNVGKQARGGGVAPSPAVSWPVGSIIREATDGKLYLRVDNTGSANDFIVLN